MRELGWLPVHKAGLHIDHNDHLNVYLTVAEWLEQEISELDWVSPEERKRAISTNECWVVQWYPDTPIGFMRIAASSLDALREYFER